MLRDELDESTETLSHRWPDFIEAIVVSDSSFNGIKAMYGCKSGFCVVERHGIRILPASAIPKDPTKDRIEKLATDAVLRAAGVVMEAWRPKSQKKRKKRKNKR